MRLLLALDSRPSNKAAFGILDPHTAGWEHFEIMDIAEPFKRRGFRGAELVGDHLYVLSSAALYIYGVDTAAGGVKYDLQRVVRRPEWEVGERAAADLHHLHYSPERNRLFVANSFMDAVDEITLEGDFVAHHYLWDISPAIADVARERNPAATDLVHCNHITEHDGRLYLTLGNWNGTRTGKVVCFDTGEIVLEDLHFPHDGFVHEGDFYISATGNSEVLIYRDVGDMNLRGREPDAVLPVKIRQPVWENSFQWVRGIHVSPGHIVCGVTQWRNESSEQLQIPPRLVFFDRASHQFQGEVFLPLVDGFPSPSIFTLIPLPDDREEQFDFQLWEESIPYPGTPDVLRIEDAHGSVAGPHFLPAGQPKPREDAGVWPGTWEPYRDSGEEEHARERLVGIVLPPTDVTSRLPKGWSFVARETRKVLPLADGPVVTFDKQGVFYTGEGWRTAVPHSTGLPGGQFLHLRFRGEAAVTSKLGCDLYTWVAGEKRPRVHELGYAQLDVASREFGLWAYLEEPVTQFRLVFRMYQSAPLSLSDVSLSLYATLPERDRLGFSAEADTTADKPSMFPHLPLLPRWFGRASA